MKTTDLRQHVASLPDAGLALTGELPAEWAAESLLDAYEARSGLSVRLEVRRVNDNVLVEGEVGITLGFQCSRTLAAAETRVVVDFAELFVPGQAHEFNLGDGIDSDLTDLMADEPYLIIDGVVDLEQLVREQLVLAQDPYPVAAEATDDERPDELPVWTSAQAEGDPRWAGLAKLKLD